MSSKAIARRRPIGRLGMVPDQAPAPTTPQSLFDLVVSSVRSQGYIKSEGESEAGMYYGSNGVRCHVGLVIPPEKYQPSFEGRVPRVLQEEGLFFLGWSEDMMDLLEEFQFIHDDSPPEQWEGQFRELAETFDLSYKPPSSRRRRR